MRKSKPASSPAGSSPGWFSASQSRSSSRKACSLGESVRSTRRGDSTGRDTRPRVPAGTDRPQAAQQPPGHLALGLAPVGAGASPEVNTATETHRSPRRSSPTWFSMPLTQPPLKYRRPAGRAHAAIPHRCERHDRAQQAHRGAAVAAHHEAVDLQEEAGLVGRADPRGAPGRRRWRTRRMPDAPGQAPQRRVAHDVAHPRWRRRCPSGGSSAPAARGRRPRRRATAHAAMVEVGHHQHRLDHAGRAVVAVGRGSRTGVPLRAHGERDRAAPRA